MSTSKAEVLHWSPADYLADLKTQRLTLEEHGAYSLLLWHMWVSGDCQSELPLDYHILASVWKCPPEEAERLLDALLRKPFALLRVKETKDGSFLVSKRLREQYNQALAFCAQQAEKGRKSGAVRRANAANSGSTENEPRLNSGSNPVEPESNPRTRNSYPVSRNTYPVPVTRSAGSYPQDGEGHSSAAIYWADKLERNLTPDEVRTVARWCKTFGEDETKVMIGYASEDGFADEPKRIYGSLMASKKRREAAS